MRTIVLAGGIALLATLFGTRVAIRILVRKGYGQLIRDDGPTSHHVKRGTPTMGGLVIIAAVLLAYVGSHLITWTPPSASALLILFLFAGLGVVGFLDDFIKISKQRSLGLRSKAKIAGQSHRRGALRARLAAVPRRAGDHAGLELHLLPARHRVAGAAGGAGGHLGDAADRRGQQRGEPDRRAGRAGLRSLRDDLRRVHAGQHLAVQPVLRVHRLGRAEVLRGAGPVRPRRGGHRA